MNVKISNGMFIALIINIVYAKAIGMTQGSMAREVGGDVWISTLFSDIQGCIIMFLSVYIIRRVPKADLFEQSSLLLGKWFGKLISLIGFTYFVAASGAVYATFVYHLKDYFLPETPTLVFIISGFIIAVFGLYLGLEVMARMAFIGIFGVILLNILIILGSIFDFDIRNLLPVFDKGIVSDFWASRHNNADWSLATMMAMVILPNIKDSKTWVKSGVIGILLGGMFVVIWPILEVGVMSAEVTGQYLISCMQMARSAEIGLFVHRYEMIMIAFFALSILSQIMMTYYCAAVSIQRLLGAKKLKTVILPVSLVVSGFGYWIVLDHHRAMFYIENYWVMIAMSIAIGVPLLILLLGLVFKKKLKAKTVKACLQESS